MPSLNPTFENLVEHCLFCGPEKHQQAEQILLRADHFYLFAGIGAIVDGYILIAPYRCDDPDVRFRSLSDMPLDIADEFAFLVDLVSSFYRDAYGSAGMGFEHGRAGTCLIPRGDTPHCYHAHFCCYPVSEPIWERMGGFRLAQVPSPHRLGEVVRDSRYLFMHTLGSGHGAAWSRGRGDARVALLAEDTELESQYLRRLLADAVGRPELWDWRTYPRVDAAERVIQTFGDWLARQQRFVLDQQPGGPPRLHFAASVAATNRIASNRIAADYHETWRGRAHYSSFGRFLRWLPTEGEARPRVLDAGCGPGTYLHALASLGIEAVGVDCSDEMLAIARKRLADAPSGSVELRQMDLLTMDLPEACFDGIWCSAFLVHCPRTALGPYLERLRRALRPGGVAYLSTRLATRLATRQADRPGHGCEIREDGRVFFLLEPDELGRAVRDAGFEVLEEWNGTSRVSTTESSAGSNAGGNHEKQWKEILVRRPADRTATVVASQVAALPARSEAGRPVAAAHVTGVPTHAPVPVGHGEALIAATRACTTPVLSLLGGEDIWAHGWLSVVSSLGELAARGARPAGVTLAIQTPRHASAAMLDELQAGAREAASAHDCHVLGAHVETGEHLACLASAVGLVRAEAVLRPEAAQPRERVLVLGDMGRFWAGVLHRLEAVPLPGVDADVLSRSLRQPRARVREAARLASQELIRCAVGSPRGLSASFESLAASCPTLDVHIDLADVACDPVVDRVATAVGVDRRKLMLSWGDWQLVCTARDQDLERLRATMAELGCPVAVVGWISKGAGRVWYHDVAHTGALSPLEPLAPTGEAISALLAYTRRLREQPLYRPAD